MKRTLYQDGIEVKADDLNNTESQKSESIKERQQSFTQAGVVSGLRVTVGAPNTVDISSGIGFCANGERIESVAVSGVTVIPAQYNFVCLVYKETEGTPKPHEDTGISYNTRVEESYDFLVMSESDYNVLSDADKDNRIVVGIEKNGIIQESLEIREEITSSLLDIVGIDLLKFSYETPYGKAWFYYEYNSGPPFITPIIRIKYKAPGDSYGSFVSLTSDGDYLLLSNNPYYTILLRVRFKFLPKETIESFTEVKEFYNPPVVGNQYNTPTCSGKEGLHRNKEGAGLPREVNPHGLCKEDLLGGASDVVVHQKRMHSAKDKTTGDVFGKNCITSQTYFKTGSTSTLKPYAYNGTYIYINELPVNDKYYIKGEGFSEVLDTNIHIIGSGIKYIGIYNATKKLIQSSSKLDENYLTLCSVILSGGNLTDFIDLRTFASHSDLNIQKESITKEKIDNTAVRNKHLWPEGDVSFIKLLVNGEKADSLHTHFDVVAEWKKKWYSKTLLAKPQDPIPEPTCCSNYDGSTFCAAENPGASLIGITMDPITGTVRPPSSYKTPDQEISIEQEMRGIGRVGKSDSNSVQEAIDYLASLMKNLKDREFPTLTEVMDTGGRVLNLTFVPLPDNHGTGKWLDGEEVKESECSWIVSPTFIWGLDAAPIPWCYICSTFGLGTGGNPNNPDNTWSWSNWIDLMQKFISGNILYGRWVIFLFFVGAASLATSLLSIMGTHANYHIIGSHQSRLDAEDHFDLGVSEHNFADPETLGPVPPVPPGPPPTPGPVPYDPDDYEQKMPDEDSAGEPKYPWET